MTIAALGDSLTQGYGLPDGDGFVPQLQAWLNAQEADVTLINAGVSGDTTSGGLSRLDWTLTPDVDAVIVGLGGNDLLRGLPAELSRSNMNEIVDRLAAKSIPTLVMALPAPKNFGPEYEATFNGIFPALAADYGVLLYPDFFAAFRDELADPTALATYMQPDANHPNAHGVSLIVPDLGPMVLDLAQRVRDAR